MAATADRLQGLRRTAWLLQPTVSSVPASRLCGVRACWA